MLTILSRFLGFLFALLLLGLLLSALLLAIYYQPLFKLVVEDYFSRKLGTRTTVSTSHLDLENMEITLSNVRVHNPPGFTKGAVANFPEMYGTFDPAGFKEGKFHFKKIHLETKDVHILRNSDGEYNWFHLATFSDGKYEADAETPNMIKRVIQKLPLAEWFEFIVPTIDEMTLDLGQAIYKDFSLNVPLTLNIPIKIAGSHYMDVGKTREVVRIIAWETLLKMEDGPLADAFKLMEKKIEIRLEGKREFLKRYRKNGNGKKKKEKVERVEAAS